MKQKLKEVVLRAFPFLYRIRIWQLRFVRHIRNLLPGSRFAILRSEQPLAYRLKQHQSLLRRKLGSSDPQLQENKIVNLSISSAQINGILLRPGETFSFWKLVGKTTARKGYIEGMLLSQGEVISGVGGGICQLANLLFWLAIHTPLTVTERHHHSFDPFPDDRRVLPFGSGASVFYNYIDLRFYNPTQQTFQFHVWLTEKHLKGAVYSDQAWPYTYHIEEREHRFIQRAGKMFRKNEIWRQTIDKKTGRIVAEERLISNFSEVKYNVNVNLTDHGMSHSQ